MRPVTQKANIIHRSPQTDAAKRAWAAAFDRCWCCGRCGGWLGLDAAHIVGASARSEEPADWTIFCRVLCHPLAHGAAIRLPRTRGEARGKLLPNISLPMMLWLKREADPLHYDRARLETLYGKPLPAEEEVPGILRRTT